MIELMRMSFEVFEHTADIGVRVFGRDLAELLRNAALALMTLITDRESVRPDEETVFELEAETGEELLIKMLSEILYLHQVRKMVFCEAEMELTDGYRLKGRLKGEKIDPGRHELLLDIKAATYHNLKIKRVNDRFMAEIVFDI
ncbi:MAG TPA: archease [Thermodesulfobacteriota bacterium]|nr:archease [Thermodesulfobacteriota bacterium]